MDSLRTSNTSIETNRLLVGSYSDPDFGEIRTESFAQYRPTSVTTSIPGNAVFDSLILQLYLDFYIYGSSGSSDLELSIHEITEELNNDLLYYSTSSVTYNGGSSLGGTTARINADFFNQEAEDTNADSVVIVKIKLSQAFGQRLFDAVDPEDENYTNFELFKTKFKGLAIIPQQSDKIVGIGSNSINTVLNMYYHYDQTNSVLQYSLSQGVNFSTISADRSMTELSGLTQYHTDFTPISNRYIQSGTSLVTKLDFSKYYEYIDTLSNIIINSAELSIENVNPEGGFNNPVNLNLGMLKANNRFKYFETKQDTLDYLEFEGSFAIGPIIDPDVPSALYAASDQGDLLYLTYSETDNNFGGAYPTLFFQRLFEQKDKPYPYWALVPNNPAPRKSVNRTSFTKDNIKLKIYYTRPFIDSPE